MAVTQLGLWAKGYRTTSAARAAGQAGVCWDVLGCAGVCWGLVLERYVPVHETPSAGPDGHAPGVR